mmetsp:Transcript_109239/g.216951  ORF Transcript_109239/g.216951 Transcript_109239/m.216951 type:complete len:475 (-) Transcript_109239:42-1466(-)
MPDETEGNWLLSSPGDTEDLREHDVRNLRVSLHGRPTIRNGSARARIALLTAAVTLVAIGCVTYGTRTNWGSSAHISGQAASEASGLFNLDKVFPQRNMLLVHADNGPEGCFVKQRAYMPLDMLGAFPQQEHDATKCQARCAQTERCKHFSYDYISRLCHLQDANAKVWSVPEAFVSGPRTCASPTTTSTTAKPTIPTSAPATSAPTVAPTTVPVPPEPAEVWQYPLQPQSLAILQPSLFCWLFLMPTGYELDLVRAQVGRRVGVFSCNSYAAFSTSKVELGPGIETIQVKGTNSSQKAFWGSWLNTQNFLKAWDMIVTDGRYRLHDWVLKADPDCVFFPERLRIHMVERVNTVHPVGPVYVRNCAKDIQMLGSMEIFSHQAIDMYMLHKGGCYQYLNPQTSGEDGFMKACMDWSNVSFVNDFNLTVDGYCNLGGCEGNMYNVAFHPYKSKKAWFKCWGAVVWADHNKTIHTPL